MNTKILVIGRGRCGTGYSAKVFQSMGLDVGHEVLGKNGSVHNAWAVQCQGRPPITDFTHVWHVVREPLAAIASIHTLRWTPDNGPAPALKYVRDVWDNPLLRAAQSYYWWNKICERTLWEADLFGIHVWRYRVEDPEWPADASARLMCEPPDVSGIPKNTNTRKGMSTHPGTITWEQLREADPRLMYDILGQALAYGYRY